MRCRRGRRGEPMADYYPLIAKAVSGLDKSTGEARRALYDRARTALLAQLRGVEPALSEPDITRERLALEEAIRKVEAESARRSRSDPPPARPETRQELRPEGRPADPPSEVAGPRYDLRASRPTIATPADEGDDLPDSEETRQAIPLSAASAKPVVELRQAEEPRTPVLRVPAASGEVPRTEQQHRSPGEGPAPPDTGLKGFRDAAAETETAGSATADAAKNVRAYQAATNADFARFEPRPDSRMDARGEPRMEPVSRRSLLRDAQTETGREPLPEPGRGVEARDSGRGRGAEPPLSIVRRQEPSSGQEADEPPAQDAWLDFEATVRSEFAARPSSTTRQEDGRGRMPSRRATRAEHQSVSAWGAPRTSNKIVAIVVLALLVLAVVAIGYWWGQDIVAAIRGTPGSNVDAGQVTPAESSARGKIVEHAPAAPAPS